MRKVIFASLLLIASTLSLAGQKYGHLNLGNLIASIPETKQADEQLEVFQKDLISKGEEMAKALQTRYTAFMQEVQSGSKSPVEQEKEGQEIQAEQQKIVQYEREVAQKVQIKREELLKPIFEKAQKAIDDVGKENGYTLIFDTSIFNAILFAVESDDVLPLVKAKLGLE